MDNVDTQQPSHQDNSDLQAQLDSLRQLVVSMLILMIVVSGTLSLYMLRQLSTTRKDLDGLRPQAEQIIGEYNSTARPAMDEFVKRVTDYGRTHADFAPIMNAYGLGKGQGTNVAPAPAAPAKK